MYVSIAADLEKDNKVVVCENAFREPMATEKAEQEFLETTIEKQSYNELHKSKALSDADMATMKSFITTPFVDESVQMSAAQIPQNPLTMTLLSLLPFTVSPRACTVLLQWIW